VPATSAHTLLMGNHESLKHAVSHSPMSDVAPSLPAGSWLFGRMHFGRMTFALELSPSRINLVSTRTIFIRTLGEEKQIGTGVTASPTHFNEKTNLDQIK